MSAPCPFTISNARSIRVFVNVRGQVANAYRYDMVNNDAPVLANRYNANVNNMDNVRVSFIVLIFFTNGSKYLVVNSNLIRIIMGLFMTNRREEGEAITNEEYVRPRGCPIDATILQVAPT